MPCISLVTHNRIAVRSAWPPIKIESAGNPAKRRDHKRLMHLVKQKCQLDSASPCRNRRFQEIDTSLAPPTDPEFDPFRQRRVPFRTPRSSRLSSRVRVEKRVEGLVPQGLSQVSFYSCIHLDLQGNFVFLAKSRTAKSAPRQRLRPVPEALIRRVKRRIETESRFLRLP